MKRYLPLLFLGYSICLYTSCKKYELEPEIKDPAYIRVFNNLSSTLDVLHGQQKAPFLTFLVDPQTDANGVPVNAAVTGDYLATRRLYSLSFAADEANSSVGNSTKGGQNFPDPPNLTPVNYEYPGNAHVLAAPVINGFDLSAWAQIPSGSHRIMFVVRPENGVNFKDLSVDIRKMILLDTTINFEKGEVYTLEVVSRDKDKAQYGLYVRKEQFIHQAFDQDKIQVGFVNLSGEQTAEIKAGFGYAFSDRVRISTSYQTYNDAASILFPNSPYYDFVQGYNNTYLTTLNTRLNTDVSFTPLPMLPQSAFFYQGLLRTYVADVSNAPGITPNQGTLPVFTFLLTNADAPGKDGVFTLKCSADPATYNNYNPQTTSVKYYTPNLNLAVNTGSHYQIYPTLNIMELAYDRVYVIQVIRGINQLPKN